MHVARWLCKKVVRQIQKYVHFSKKKITQRKFSLSGIFKKASKVAVAKSIDTYIDVGEKYRFIFDDPFRKIFMPGPDWEIILLGHPAYKAWRYLGRFGSLSSMNLLVIGVNLERFLYGHGFITTFCSFTCCM